MPYLVGTDEAGYGPNLGPLVVTASAWRVETLKHTDLFSRLRGTVCLATEEPTSPDEILIGDSKQLYKPGKGLAKLELGVLASLATIDKNPPTWRKLWRDVAKQDVDDLSELPWYCDFDQRLPVDVSREDIASRTERLASGCEQASCELTQIESRLVFPRRFNELVERHGNKATVLSQTTLHLVRQVLANVPDDEPVYVLCDKHGGRNKYGPLLNETFPETLAVVRSEGRSESVYQLGSGNGRREIAFRMQADVGFLPAALASMVSKYLRELAMRAFNNFWTSHVDDLKPTAGYPLDARRFRQQIEATQKRLGIDDRILWRCR